MRMHCLTYDLGIGPWGVQTQVGGSQGLPSRMDVGTSCGLKTGRRPLLAVRLLLMSCSCVEPSRTRPRSCVGRARCAPSASPKHWTTRSSGVSGVRSGEDTYELQYIMRITDAVFCLE